MTNLSIFFTAIALSMDAVAVSICKGLCLTKINIKTAIKIGIYFGTFQGIMPLIGYFLSYKLLNNLIPINNLIAFTILSIIGINMIYESNKKETNNYDNNLSIKIMIILSIATSIDALSIGISFGILKVNIIYSVTIISIVTFILSTLAVYIGNIFGEKYKNKAVLSGGIILIIIAIKILLEYISLLH